MSFLSTIFLAALPLVLVPVAIHFYRGRQRDVIHWGAMKFLAKAVTRGRSMQRLEELLLMLLRVAAVTALVLALARPMVRSSWLGEGGDREVILVIDDSMSTARLAEGGTLFEQMAEKIRGAIHQLSETDEVHVLLATGGGRWLTADGVLTTQSGKDRLFNAIDQLQPNQGSANLLAALQTAVHVESSPTATARHILVFTDNQSLSWHPEELPAWEQLNQARRDAKLPLSIEVVALSPVSGHTNNLAVTQLELSRKLARPDEALQIAAQVTNQGTQPSESAEVEWLINGAVVDRSPLASLEPQQANRVETTLREDSVGTYAVSCRIAIEDQLALDDQSTLVLQIADNIPVLIVHDRRSGNFDKSAKELLFAALGYERENRQAWYSMYHPEVIAPEELTGKQLAEYRAVVITSLGDIDPDAQENLRSYVRAGGGLWIALGDQITSESFNHDWYQDGAGLSPASVTALRSIEEENVPSGQIHPPSGNHPTTAQLANTTQLDIDEARLSEYWTLSKPGTQHEEFSVLLEAGDGSPLVVENYFGQGRVIVQAFPLGLQWGNLPRLKMFVVMVYDWLDYLTAPAAARHNLLPGEAIVANVPQESPDAAATLITPEGESKPLVSHSAGEDTVLRYSQTHVPGLYRVQFESDGRQVASVPYVVQGEVEESQFKPLTRAEQSRLAEMAQLQFLSAAELVEVAPIEMADAPPRQSPVWGGLLLALILFLAAELLLANWISRQRAGYAVSTT